MIKWISFRQVPYLAIESITNSKKTYQHKNKKDTQQHLVVIGIVIKCHFRNFFIKKDGQKAMETQGDKKESAKNEFLRVRIKIVKKKELSRKDYHHIERAVMIVL